jgi:hypothetical protein
MPTAGAEKPADPKGNRTPLHLDRTVVITMDSQTAGVPTGTDKLMELERIDGIVIKFLRNRIATIDRYSYHKHMRLVYECCQHTVTASLHTWCACGRKPNSGRGGSCYSYLQIHGNDNRRYKIKQSVVKCNGLLYAVPSFNLAKIRRKGSVQFFN